MSVIVAKSAICCGTGTAPVTNYCYPAVSVQRIVPTGSTLTIDGITTSGFRGVMWYVVVSNSTGVRVRTYQFLATHRNGTSPSFGQRAILGDMISHTPNVVVTGGVMSLTVTNSDNEDLIVYVTRLAIPLTFTQLNMFDVVDIGMSRSVVRAGATVTVDFVPTPDHIAASWLVSGYASTGERFACQIYALLIDGVTETHYAISGDVSLTYDIIITEVTGMGVELAVRNTSATLFAMSMTRIPVQLNAPVPYCGTGSGLDLWIPAPVTIAPGATATVDSAGIPAHAGVKWLFGAMAAGSFRTMVAEINATTPTQTTATHVIFGMIGDFLDLDITTAIVGSDLVLTLTNNEVTSVTVNLLRVPVPT